jgi:hypothetical protein
LRRLFYRCAAVTALCAGAFVGCTCETVTPPPPKPANAAVDEKPAAPPAGPEIPGIYCTGEGVVAPAAPGAFHVGPVVASKLPNWDDPPDESARFLVVPGVNDTARSVEDGAWMVRHKIPNSERMLVLTAKPHHFPDGSTFDAAGMRKVFDEVAANPRTALIGTRALTWGGRPAVEGTVSTPYPDGTNLVVHHLIVQSEKTDAMVMTYVAPDPWFHKYLGEACAAVTVAK